MNNPKQRIRSLRDNPETLFRIGTIFILVLGLINNLYGIKFGLPYVYDPDEPTWVAAANGILANRDLNPHEFGHPGSTTIYFLAALYAGIYVIGLAIGKFQSPEDFRLLYHEDPTLVYLSGRLVSVLFSLAAVFMLIMIAKRLLNNRPAALVAGLLLAINPLFVHFSKFIRTDIQVSFWILIAFWFCLNIFESHKLKDHILAGFFSGLAVATKYPAAIIIIVIIIAHFFENNYQIKSIHKLVTAGMASVAGLFFTAPFLFLDYQSAIEDLIKEARPEHLNATSEGFVSNLWWYLSVPLSESITWIAIGLCIIGVYFSLKNRQKGLWLALVFVIAFMVFISNLSLRWDRWIIPIMPFLTLLISYSLVQVFQFLKRRSRFGISVAVTAVLFFSIVIPQIRTDLLDGGSLAGKPTRTEAAEWMMANLSPGSKVLMEIYTAILPKDEFKFFYINSDRDLVSFNPEDSYKSKYSASGHIGNISDVNLIEEEGIQYIVMSQMYSRYKAEKDKYPQVVANYEKIIADSTLIFQVKAVPGKSSGPTISIYQVP